jgi:DNA invertase Pin-like site-specific DNA recombinase
MLILELDLCSPLSINCESMQQTHRVGAINTDTALTKSSTKETTMATKQLSNNSIFSQEPTQPIIRVALYARVSTLNNQDPEMQLSELREYVGHRGWKITEEFTDQGVSGCKESRPALNRLMSDACRRKFDAILVWKIDRFGRSLKHLVNSLAELAALGVAFISLRDNLDLSTPSGRLMFQIIGAMAEFERALIQERVRAGLRNARAKGRRLGRPRVIVDAPRIALLRGQGRSWAQIEKETGVSKGTAQRAFVAFPKID